MIIFREGACPIKVLDTPDSESDLEKDMIDWNMQSAKNKKLSDDKSIELFGKTNQDRYEEFKHQFLKNKQDEPEFKFNGLSLLKEEETLLDIKALNKDRLNTIDKIAKSKRYTASTTNVIIYPVTDKEELEKLKADYDSMTVASKHKADDECLAIWGVSNDVIYSTCADIIEKQSNGVDCVTPNWFSDEVAIDGYTQTISAKEISDAKANLESYILPSKDHIFPISIRSSINESTIDSSLVEMMTKPRNELLPLLLYRYDKIEDKSSNEAVYIEESILRMGWVPGIPYNATTRYKAALLEKTEDVSKFDIVDATKMEVSTVSNTVKNDILYPVYIVLVEGTSVFSHTIKAVTNGPFSHAGLCIDETFKKIYSFNMLGSEGKMGGLTHEDIKGYPAESKLGVFTIFVKEKDYNTIQTLLEIYDKNEKNTSYSILNVIAIPFSKAIKMDFNMICSEFVDNILKLTNIDIVDKASPLVTPNDFYRASKANKKIYKVYEGKVKHFLPKTISNRINKIKKEYIKEMAMLESEFPIQFSDDGDLLIHNIGKIDYEAEIAKSKRLMKIYYKEDNREGLKYEIAKMYFIGNLIGLDIERGKIKDKSYPAKSHAYNLVSTYLRLLLQREKDFNFSEYYESTPFNDAVTTIKASTLKYSIKMLKDIILA